MAGLLTLLVSGQQTYVVGSNRTEAQQTARLVFFRNGERGPERRLRSKSHGPVSCHHGADAAAGRLPHLERLERQRDHRHGRVGQRERNAEGRAITDDVTSAGTILRRQESVIDTSPVTVTNAINSIAFRYLDADDAVVANPRVLDNALNIRTVEITVSAKPDTQKTSTSQQVSVVSVVRVRVRNR
jgi:hypothetical protein